MALVFDSTKEVMGITLDPEAADQNLMNKP
jgi:hypothetical protein